MKKIEIIQMALSFVWYLARLLFFLFNEKRSSEKLNLGFQTTFVLQSVLSVRFQQPQEASSDA